MGTTSTTRRTVQDRASRPEWAPRDTTRAAEIAARHRLIVEFNFGPDVLAADNWTQLCEEVISGYSQLADDDLDGQLRARILYALDVQVKYQAFINGHLDLSGVSPEDLAVLEGDRVHQPDIRVWRSRAPLFLVDCLDYEPYGPKPRPVGWMEGSAKPDENLSWIRPQDEMSLWRSLADIQIVTITDNEVLSTTRHPNRLHPSKRKSTKEMPVTTRQRLSRQLL